MKSGWLAAASLLAAAIAGPSAGGDEPKPDEIRKPIEPDQLREQVLVHVRDVEGAAVSSTENGLKVTAFVVPDALAYLACKEYLARREAGKDHREAIGAAARRLNERKRSEGQASVRVKIENQDPRGAGASPVTGKLYRRVYTLEKAFLGGALTLTGPGGKPMKVRLDEQPRNLRKAQIRIKKHWKTADGQTRRGASDPNDPASVGRVPLIGKPRPALLVEDNPVEVELLVSPKALKVAQVRLGVQDFKRYDGPFDNDHLDLNGGRTHDPVKAMALDLHPPPGGLEAPRAARQLLFEVQQAAQDAPLTP